MIEYSLTQLVYDIGLQNVSNIDFHLSEALNVKCDGAVLLPIYDFLLVFNGNI